MQSVTLGEVYATLLTEGLVIADGSLAPVDRAALPGVLQLFRKYYEEDCLNMPYTAPAFYPDAVEWASVYFYQAIQLLIRRDAGEDSLQSLLVPYSGTMSASAIYSADLVLRHLPSLLSLAKGLSPGDMLVKLLKETAAQWPLSSVGVETDSCFNQQLIFDHPSLKQLYIDRIIRQKDYTKAKHPEVAAGIRESLGEKISFFLPEWQPHPELAGLT